MTTDICGITQDKTKEKQIWALDEKWESLEYEVEEELKKHKGFLASIYTRYDEFNKDEIRELVTDFLEGY